MYVDLPSDITAIAQYYTVHCTVTGSLDDATIKHYYDDDSDIILTQSYCTDTHDGYSCSVDSQSITTNYTYTDISDYIQLLLNGKERLSVMKHLDNHNMMEIMYMSVQLLVVMLLNQYLVE